ncbi:MAG: hypothetical protein MI923_11740 [Phycisphaerales bacterium]|nr:hypothetical protein [Phycisphaerales bacterium]
MFPFGRSPLPNWTVLIDASISYTSFKIAAGLVSNKSAVGDRDVESRFCAGTVRQRLFQARSMRCRPRFVESSLI